MKMADKIRIAFVIPSLGKGGAERLLIDICRQLHGNSLVDYQLVVLNPINEYTSLTEGLNIKHISVKVNTFRINYRRNDRRNDLQEWFNFIDSYKPGIIHSHIYFADLVARSRIDPGIKFFSHLHGRTTQFEKPPISFLLFKPRLYFEQCLERLNIRKLFNKSKTVFLCVSGFYKEYLEKNLGYERSIVFQNAIDYSRFYFERTYKQSTRLHLITAGRLVEDKNHGFLVRVAKVLKERGIDFELTILGEGQLKSNLLAYIKKSNLSNEVLLLGNVNNPEGYYKEADIYLHSAWDESFGLTLLEALASGLPVITLDGKGNRDLIVQGKNGFMLFEQDAEKFAGKIIEVWEDKTLYKEMSSFGQEFARKYDIKDYVDRLLKVYQDNL